MNLSRNTLEHTAVADARQRPDLRRPDPRKMAGFGARDADLRRDTRAQPRLGTAMAATVRTERGERPGCIRNLSRRGAMLSMTTPPKRGEFIEIVTGGRSLIGQVRWSDDCHAGIALRDSIDANSLVAGKRAPVAAHREAFRKPVSAPVSANLNPSAHIIARQLQFAAMIAFGVVMALMIAFSVNDLHVDVAGQIKAGLPG